MLPDCLENTELLQEMMEEISLSMPKIHRPPTHDDASNITDPPPLTSHPSVKQSDSPPVSDLSSPEPTIGPEAQQNAQRNKM